MSQETLTSTDSAVFELDSSNSAAHPYDQLKRWIAEHEFTHLRVSTGALTTIGEIEVVEGAQRKPAQITHVAACSNERAIVISSPTAWPDQIDQPPFEEPVYINPRITRLEGLR